MWEAQFGGKEKKNKGLPTRQLEQCGLEDTQKNKGFKGGSICPDLADTDSQKLEHAQDFILLYIPTALSI